jgi:molybdopterin converting factor small subunit
MKVRVEISFSFKRDVDPQGVVLELPDGADVRAALRGLVRRYPAIEPRLFGPRGEVHRHINALVNGRNVAFKKGFGTILRDGDGLTLLPPIGGG